MGAGDIRPGSWVDLRQGRAILRGVVVEIRERPNARQAVIRVGDGERAVQYVRNVHFLVEVSAQTADILRAVVREG